MEELSKICKNCSSVIENNAKFCGVCGTEYEEVVQVQNNAFEEVAVIEQVANLGDDNSYKASTSIVKRKMGFFQLMFSPTGRIGRGTFIKGTLLAMMLWGGIAIAALVFVGIVTRIFPENSPIIGFFGMIAGVAFLVCLPGFWWSGTCLGAKRQHDLGLSYKNSIFMSLNPFYAIKLTFDIFLTEGRGPNKYGEYSQ